MTRPWVVHCPEGTDPASIDYTALMRALPGDCGVLVIPADVPFPSPNVEQGTLVVRTRPAQ